MAELRMIRKLSRERLRKLGELECWACNVKPDGVRTILRAATLENLEVA